MEINTIIYACIFKFNPKGLQNTLKEFILEHIAFLKNQTLDSSNLIEHT